MNCQRCGSNNILSINGKTSDMFSMELNGNEYNGYVPKNLFFGKNQYGNYINMSFCTDCGQIQSEFPITDQVNTWFDIDENEEND